jgi:hypothetical protein
MRSIVSFSRGPARRRGTDVGENEGTSREAQRNADPRQGERKM